MDNEVGIEEQRAKLIGIFSQRSKEGATPANDSELLQPEFIELTDEGLLTLKFPVLNWQRNQAGNLQGGMISCMMDLPFGAFAYVTFGFKPPATINMITNYIRPIGPSEDSLIIKTIFRGKGRRILYGESEAYNIKGKLTATASTNIIRI
ncbi:MAG: PaaI family thioesterase [Leptospirales bacterium]|nr:PaaI family thioesterase [Leptospirales bacterium]